MKKVFTVACIAAMTILTTNLLAQSQDEMQKWTDYMTPGDMHKWLAKSDGKWDEAITLWMAPGAPPTTSTATCENKMILGGRYQESKHTGSFMNMPFEGYSLVGYDNARKVFQSTWIDNMGSGIMNLEGTYDAATKTVTFKGKSTDPMTGAQVDVRETFQVIDDNNQVMEMFMVQGGQEFKTMNRKFTRKM